MKPARPFLTGVWVLAIIAVFRIFLFAVLYYSYTHQPFYTARSRFLSFSIYFFIFLPVIEAYIYWLLRYNIPKKTWVYLHVWPLFTALVFTPVIMFAIIFFGGHFSSEFYSQFWSIERYFFIGLIIVGHIFFIATIVRNFTKKKELNTDEPAPGLLDEFIN